MQQEKLKNKGDIKYLSIDDWLSEDLVIAFSTRVGGYSSHQYTSLNLGLHVGDNKDQVINNRRKFLSYFDIELSSTVSCEQVHGNKIIRVTDKHKGLGAYSDESSLLGYDGMICNTPNLYLLTYYADCVPVFFYDPQNRAVGLAHSGWKGTMGNIAVETVYAMEKNFNCHRQDIKVYIGPGIARCCFEIQKDLVEKVSEKYNEISDIILLKDNNGYKWDLHSTVRIMLEKYGVLSKNIICSSLCSFCNSDLFFSYRRDRGSTGRMTALIGLSN
ncbi:Multicopper polyphenol oxidase [Candidatus Syntrophocurvum alkaliphilum]|uniref:Purine nucleoside phosphorylase n=1 Tax=Candidatus Syntrophocurvum alkaliphilum TaxID=2293317 RepID=A0A6I6DA29_9FIRM|nr:peptidoglycan editing factor PgeF [Candidatus Syntrophocurvum alkaliphilum]QGT99698.1 Multicopper polyphenol oxidase [Candidatus Syntrophocurvum alkaliphilum]